MAKSFYNIAFTDAVLAMQAEQGSDKMYARQMAPDAPAQNRLGPDERRFIALRDGFYQATVSETGWPYVQFRGGSRGFLKVLDDQTLAYADFRGNRQYISDGNLSGDGRISMILMDYPNAVRLKVLGRAKLSDDTDLIAQLTHAEYNGRPERAVVITVEGFDWNCPQHIPQRLTMEEMAPMLAPFQEELGQLRAENAALKAKLGER